jgi:carbamoyltransferase
VFYAWNSVCGQSRRASLNDLCLGPAYSSEEIKKVIENCKLRFRYFLTTDEVIETAVVQLTDNKIVAWMHGRMEFGPRALGNRSILASPQDPYSAENLNTYIKHRESFRKFAASVPAEVAAEYFEVGPNARYLATVGRVRERYRKCFDPGARGIRRGQPPVLEAAARRRQEDRPAGAVQHLVQSLRRAAGLHASRCRAEFLFLRH